MDEVFWQCFHCVDSTAGEPKTRPLSELIHCEGVGEVINFDSLCIGVGGPLRNNGVDTVPSRHRRGRQRLSVAGAGGSVHGISRTERCGRCL